MQTTLMGAIELQVEMSGDQDRSLQIEIARLQIKNEQAMSTFTIMLSIFVALLVTLLSVYVPLYVTTGNIFYLIYTAMFEPIIGVAFLWVLFSMRNFQRHIEKQVIELRKKYLVFGES